MLKLNIDDSSIEFGLWTLHSWIRFFECLIHLSYRLNIKKWQIRDTSNKKLFSENEIRIQRQFKEKLGLLVDRLKPGYDNSNDGNMARDFFRETRSVLRNHGNRFKCH